MFDCRLQVEGKGGFTKLMQKVRSAGGAQKGYWNWLSKACCAVVPQLPSPYCPSASQLRCGACPPFHHRSGWAAPCCCSLCLKPLGMPFPFQVRVGGPTVLYHGALAASAATFVGHYPWVRAACWQHSAKGPAGVE